MNADELFERGDELSTEGARARQAGEIDEAHDWFRQAIDAYREALGVAPDSDPLLALNLKLCIGARHGGLEETDEAMALYEEVRGALEADPALLATDDGRELHQTARLNRADSLLGLGRVDEAREEIEAVRDENPDHPYVEYLLTRLPESG